MTILQIITTLIIILQLADVYMTNLDEHRINHKYAVLDFHQPEQTQEVVTKSVFLKTNAHNVTKQH